MARSSWAPILAISLLLITAVGCGGGGQNITLISPPTPTPTPTPGPSSTVSVTILPPAPVAVAEQIGVGSWTSVSLPGNGTLVVTLPAGTTQYGVALMCTATRLGEQANTEWVVEADLKDGASYNLQLCLTNTSTPATGAITGNVDASAVSGTQMVNINAAGNGEVLSAAPGPFSITADTGITDLYAIAESATAPLAVKIVRGQTIPGTANGGNPIVLSPSDAVTVQSITLANVPAGFTPPQIGPSPFYVTANSELAVGIEGSPAPQQYYVVSNANAQPGDFYFFQAVSGATNQEVSTQQYFSTAAPVTLTLPDPWMPPAPAAATFPTFTFNYTGFSGQAAVADVALLNWMQGAAFNAITVYATANHQNGTTTVTIPNLTALPGAFPMAPSGTTVKWFATTSGGTAQPFLSPPPVPQTTSAVSGNGSYTQP